MLSNQLAVVFAGVAALSVCTACNADTPMPSGLTPSSTLLDSAFAVCNVDVPTDNKVQIVAHGEGAKEAAPVIRSALSIAVDYAAANYDWAPEYPVCVHVFSTTGSFIHGLQEMGGLGRASALTYAHSFGTVGREVNTGFDAMYLNVAVSLSPNWEPFLATHEYFHIVQGHVGGTMGGSQGSFATWFIEGVADWEATKLQGAPFENWLDMVRREEERGHGLSLSSLVAWRQWSQIRTSAQYVSAINKARAAAMFLEEIAGPEAAPRILRANLGGDLTGFENAFRQVSGLDLQEFEARLREFVLGGHELSQRR